MISLKDYRERFVDHAADEQRRAIVERIRSLRFRTPRGKTTIDILRGLTSNVQLDTIICRFMDFPKFRDLFANEELYFRRTDLFKEIDPEEATVAGVRAKAPSASAYALRLKGAFPSRMDAGTWSPASPRGT